MARRDRRTTHGNRWRRPLSRASRPRRYPRRAKEAAEIQQMTRMGGALRRFADSAQKTARGFRDLSEAIDRAVEAMGNMTLSERRP